ncbi:hypothetical protein D3C87_1865410 [compost metagenome]
MKSSPLVSRRKKAASQSQWTATCPETATTRARPKKAPATRAAPVAMRANDDIPRPFRAERSQAVTRIGVSKKTSRGFRDWNQVIGMDQSPSERSTSLPIHRARVLPTCS